MAKIGTYPSAAILDGTEELVGVQSAASVKLTPDDLKQYINNPVYKNAAFTAVAGDAVYGAGAIPRARGADRHGGPGKPARAGRLLRLSGPDRATQCEPGCAELPSDPGPGRRTHGLPDLRVDFPQAAERKNLHGTDAGWICLHC